MHSTIYIDVLRCFKRRRSNKSSFKTNWSYTAKPMELTDATQLPFFACSLPHTAQWCKTLHKNRTHFTKMKTDKGTQSDEFFWLNLVQHVEILFNVQCVYSTSINYWPTLPAILKISIPRSLLPRRHVPQIFTRLAWSNVNGCFFPLVLRASHRK